MLNTNITPKELRTLNDNSYHDSHTAGYCKGYVQANLVVLPLKFAGDFEVFCKKNPKPCPVLEKIGPDNFCSKKLAKGADIRTCISKYRVFKDGVLVDEPKNMLNFYKKDQVFFLTGCSYSFENSLLHAGITLRHVSEGKNVAMYNTNIELNPHGPFFGNMVVSMRPIKKNRVDDAINVTGHYPQMHGAPVHIGSPQIIGINNINTVDYGESVVILDDEVPVFWACGVTPQNVLFKAKIPFAITHAPGYMFVSDLKDDTYYE